MNELLKATNVSKSYGNVKALSDVDFHVGNNEMVGLVGDNGAGKTTLIKILMGVVRPDSGEIYFDGNRLEGHSPQKARRLGIEPVYQNQALALNQPLWRNVFLGRENTFWPGFIKVIDEKKETRKLLKKKMGFAGDLSPDTKAKNLSGGERQGLAISRALFFEAKLLILDEPTTALSLGEVEKVLSFVRMVRKKGRSGIFISHDIRDVHEVTDRIVILDKGKKVGAYGTEDLTEESLRKKMRAVI